MNNVSIIGRLVRENELRYSDNGTAVLKNTIAVNRKFKKDESDFISILAFQKTAELIANHLNKGDQLGIEGHIQTGSYEKDGKKIYTTEVVVDSITFIGGGKKDNSQSNTPPPTQGYTRVGDDPFAGSTSSDESELPF